MAEYSTPEERTEMPTDRRMGQLRKEGSLHMSTEVMQVATLVSGMFLLTLIWSPLYGVMCEVLRKAFQLAAQRDPLTAQTLYTGFIGVVLMVGPWLLIVILGVSTVGILAVMLQTKWNVKEKKIHFRWNFINPITGLKRIFSIQGLVNTLKSLFKLALILPIAYFSLKGFAPEMVQLVHLSVDQILEFSGIAMYQVFWKILYILIAFAIFDFFWGKYQWLKHNKMTKDEVKDERKAVEGDEETKRAIQRKGLQRILQRIMQSVPKADVVVTNPTHLAVALKYDRHKMDAPMVLAKGQGFLAERIKEVARQAGVPILERKPLARALYESVKVGMTIPRELYRAVAEVLAYVYRLKNPYGQAGVNVS